MKSRRLSYFTKQIIFIKGSQKNNPEFIVVVITKTPPVADRAAQRAASAFLIFSFFKILYLKLFFTSR